MKKAIAFLLDILNFRLAIVEFVGTWTTIAMDGAKFAAQKLIDTMQKYTAIVRAIGLAQRDEKRTCFLV